MAKFKVWLAAETLLYMPVYALEDLGILSRVAAVAGLNHATVKVAASPLRGDRNCIEYMLQEANNETDTGDIHIAICDPVKALQINEGEKSLSLLGAFIKRPPFWVVGRQPRNDQDPGASRYVHYTDKFEPGHFLGRRIAGNVRDEDRQTCELGQEFRILDESDKEHGAGRTRAVTADIRRLVECQQADPNMKIIKRVSREADLQQFITTGVLTHRKYSRAQGEALSLFMEALRSACILLRTAEKPTSALVEQIMIREDADAAAARGEAPSPPPEGLKEIAEGVTKELFSEEIYADSLSLTHAEWMGALRARSFDPKAKRAASLFFFRVYDARASRNLTGTWLMRAIKDYGRFAAEARRLRGASAVSLMSTVLLGLHVLIADKYARGQTDILGTVLQWTSMGSLLFGAAMLATVVLMLIKDGRGLITPLQKIYAMDDSTATVIIVSSATLVFFAISGFVAKNVMHADIDWVSFLFTASGAAAAILVFGAKLWWNRDA